MELTGQIIKVLFYNYTNYYSIFKFKTANNIAICKGILPLVSEGRQVTLYGEYSTSSYSSVDNFEFTTYKSELQFDLSATKGILKLIPNVGIKTITSLLDNFGDKTLDIVLNKPNELMQIPKLGEKKIYLIHSNTKRIVDTIKILDCFDSKTIPVKSILNVISRNKSSNIMDEIIYNPFVLCKLDYSIKAQTIDMAISSKKIVTKDSKKNRIEAFFIDSFKRSPSTRLPIEQVIRNVIKNTKMEAQDLNQYFEMLSKEGSLLTDSKTIKLGFVDDYEKAISKKLVDISFKNKLENYESIVLQNDDFKTLSFEQKVAVKNSLEENLSIITGGPGTGKSKVISIIFKIFDELNKKVLIITPTGKAAQRFSQLNRKINASTISLALIKEENFDNYDICIIDEMSMVDIELFKNVLDKISNKTRLVLCGDPQQLPPVGYGEPFINILNADVFPVSKLEKIFRQESKDITDIATMLLYGNTQDFIRFIRKNSSKSVYYKGIQSNSYNSIMISYFFGFVQKFGIDKTIDMLNILIPVKNESTKTSVCTSVINKEIAIKLDPNRKKYGYTYELKTGDKIINTQNDYDKGIMNGEQGKVGKITDSGEIYIRYNDFVLYKNWELSDIDFAYGITIHKSQGSESDFIMLPLTKEHYGVLNKRMLYTAVTRAKKGIFFIGPDINTNSQDLFSILNCPTGFVENNDLSNYISKEWRLKFAN